MVSLHLLPISLGSIPFPREESCYNLSLMANPGSIPRERQVLVHLHQINRRMDLESDRGKLIQFILDQAIALSRAERGFLIFKKPEGDGYDIPVARNIGLEVIDHPMFEVSRGIIDEAWKTGQPVVLDNAKKDEEFGTRSSVAILRLASVACLPLRRRSKTIGAFYLDNRNRSGLFQAEDMLVLELFADYASTAVRQSGSSAGASADLQDMEAENERLRRSNQELKGSLLVLSDRLKELEKGMGGPSS